MWRRLVLDNIYCAQDMPSLARSRRHVNDFERIHKGDLETFKAHGWSVSRKNANSFRMFRAKPKSAWLEDRVWTLMYNMGFDKLSGKGGARLKLDPANAETTDNQIDVVALDSEIALAIECKSCREARKDGKFQSYVAKHSEMKIRFSQAVHKQFALERNRIPIMVIWTWDVIVSKPDRERAENQQVVLLDEHDLEYYEQLVAHLGSAAKYQFYSDLLPRNRKVPGLKRDFPALRGRMGAWPCFTFSVSPEYLLKIAYVAHRAKGRASDMDTYQRMIKKSRLKEIGRYIEAGGVFPTNVVVNLQGKGCARFDKGDGAASPEGADYGTIHIAPGYGSAWIIDGQHRLFAYAGRPEAHQSHLTVLAFVNLPIDEQTRLFMDINHEQKSVPRGLLEELADGLYWFEDDEETRLRAIRSRVAKVLNEEKGSPFHDRIVFEGDRQTSLKCISLGAMSTALKQEGMFIVKKGASYGPLWAVENERTLDRTVTVLEAWFTLIREGAAEWWGIGRAAGGGLAMNDSIVALTMVLNRVFQHLAGKSDRHLVDYSADELIEMVAPFGRAIGEYLGGFDEVERKAYRDFRGVQGYTVRRNMCEIELAERFPSYRPPGLQEQVEQLKAGTRQQAFPIVDRIETRLHRAVIEGLKDAYGDTQDEWWWKVPRAIRDKVDSRRNEDDGAKGGRENYFEILDFRRAILQNWDLFSGALAEGQGNKDQRTHWIEDLNEVRLLVMHASKGVQISFAQLDRLKEIDAWLEKALDESSTAVSATPVSKNEM
jgi:DNA sulfur modification protein DndB